MRINYLSWSSLSVPSRQTNRALRLNPKPSRSMGSFWTLLTHLHSVAGPVVMLMYPLYASVIAIESTSRVDDEQWLAYWILYSFFTLVEMPLQPLLTWIPLWHDIKLVLMAWLVLPQFRGAAFIYERFVREKMKQYGVNLAKDRFSNGNHTQHTEKSKKGEHQAS